jgi:hypothetical protein
MAISNFNGKLLQSQISLGASTYSYKNFCAHATFSAYRNKLHPNGNGAATKRYARAFF